MQSSKIWITGASSGIGESLAYLLASRGSTLCLSARRLDELQRVAEKCVQRGANHVMVLPIDLADSSNFQAKVKRVMDELGSLDVVIHNAGISQRSLAFETDISVDRKIMEVNYFGTVALTKALLPIFRNQNTGHFVVVSSLVGKFGTPYRSAYAASKHALHGFFDSLRAEEHQNNLTISLICPGFVKTNISINALVGDGKALGLMDDAQANGIDSDECAYRILKAIDRKEKEVNIGKFEKYGVYLKRFFPSLFSYYISRAKVR
ncbi:MAG: SDR family oxidoreductase [Cyclobacteriaceae bacterium]|nr:SDR family oxidoreductase [Cyclobacteriaceae bacterium]MCH8515587.1 SDR family oxidoreductase [Cyclobacteriaceae bacterium]